MFRAAFITAALFASLVAHSDENSQPLVVAGGGTTFSGILAQKGAAIEKFAGTKIDYKKYKSSLAVNNLSKGVIDGFFGPRVDSLSKAVEKEFNVPPLKLDDFRQVPVVTANVYVWYKNTQSIDNLTPEQIEKILAGETTSWKPINGKDAKLEAYFAHDKTFITTALSDKYLGGKPLKINEAVDDAGLVRILVSNPNAIAFSTEMDPTLQKELKKIPAHVTYQHYLTIRRNGRPEAQKMIEWFEKNAAAKP